MPNTWIGCLEADCSIMCDAGASAVFLNWLNQEEDAIVRTAPVSSNASVWMGLSPIVCIYIEIYGDPLVVKKGTNGESGHC